MKQIYTCAFCILIPFFVFSQKKASTYKVVYDHTRIVGNGDIIPGEKTILLYNEKKAVSWNDRSNISNTEPYSEKIDKSVFKTMFVYKNFDNSTSIFEANSNLLPPNKRVFSDTLHPMKWEITGEEKIIDSIKCINAICFFRGRQYSAWFAPEIPINNGPWKFGGLPGLIISIADNEGKYAWKFKSLEVSNDGIPDTPSCKGNYEDFKTAYSVGIKKVQEFASASSTSVNPDCMGCGQTVTIKIETIEIF